MNNLLLMIILSQDPVVIVKSFQFHKSVIDMIFEAKLSIYNMDAGPRTPGNLKNSRSFFIFLWKSRYGIFSVASTVGSICKVFHVLFKPLEFYSHGAIGTTIWLWHRFKISDECQNVMKVCFEKGVWTLYVTFAWNPFSIRNVV